MHYADKLNELCGWDILWASKEAMHAAEQRHEDFHIAESQRYLIVEATLKRAARVGFAGLSERERDIIRAYNAGAYLPV